MDPLAQPRYKLRRLFPAGGAVQRALTCHRGQQPQPAPRRGSSAQPSLGASMAATGGRRGGAAAGVGTSSADGSVQRRAGGGGGGEAAAGSLSGPTSPSSSSSSSSLSTSSSSTSSVSLPGLSASSSLAPSPSTSPSPRRRNGRSGQQVEESTTRAYPGAQSSDAMWLTATELDAAADGVATTAGGAFPGAAGAGGGGPGGDYTAVVGGGVGAGGKPLVGRAWGGDGATAPGGGGGVEAGYYDNRGADEELPFAWLWNLSHPLPQFEQAEVERGYTHFRARDLTRGWSVPLGLICVASFASAGNSLAFSFRVGWDSPDPGFVLWLPRLLWPILFGFFMLWAWCATRVTVERYVCPDRRRRGGRWSDNAVVGGRVSAMASDRRFGAGNIAGPSTSAHVPAPAPAPAPAGADAAAPSASAARGTEPRPMEQASQQKKKSKKKSKKKKRRGAERSVTAAAGSPTRGARSRHHDPAAKQKQQRQQQQQQQQQRGDGGPGRSASSRRRGRRRTGARSSSPTNRSAAMSKQKKDKRKSKEQTAAEADGESQRRRGAATGSDHDDDDSQRRSTLGPEKKRSAAGSTADAVSATRSDDDAEPVSSDSDSGAGSDSIGTAGSDSGTTDAGSTTTTSDDDDDDDDDADENVQSRVQRLTQSEVQRVPAPGTGVNRDFGAFGSGGAGFAARAGGRGLVRSADTAATELISSSSAAATPSTTNSRRYRPAAASVPRAPGAIDRRDDTPGRHRRRRRRQQQQPSFDNTEFTLVSATDTTYREGSQTTTGLPTNTTSPTWTEALQTTGTASSWGGIHDSDDDDAEGGSVAEGGDAGVYAGSYYSGDEGPQSFWERALCTADWAALHVERFFGVGRCPYTPKDLTHIVLVVWLVVTALRLACAVAEEIRHRQCLENAFALSNASSASDFDPILAVATEREVSVALDVCGWGFSHYSFIFSVENFFNTFATLLFLSMLRLPPNLAAALLGFQCVGELPLLFWAWSSTPAYIYQLYHVNPDWLLRQSGGLRLVVAVGFYAAVYFLDISLRRSFAAAELQASTESFVKTRTRFLATVSHEIRTPLHVMILAQHALLETGPTPEQREILEMASTSGDLALSMLRDTLDLAAADSGQLALRPVQASLKDDVIVIAPLQRLAADKGIRLSAFVDPACPLDLFVDATRVSSAIWNLAANAVKYTPTGGHVTVLAMPMPVVGAGPDAHALAEATIGSRAGALLEAVQEQEDWEDRNGITHAFNLSSEDRPRAGTDATSAFSWASTGVGDGSGGAGPRGPDSASSHSFDESGHDATRVRFASASRTTTPSSSVYTSSAGALGRARAVAALADEAGGGSPRAARRARSRSVVTGEMRSIGVGRRSATPPGSPKGRTRGGSSGGGGGASSGGSHSPNSPFPRRSRSVHGVVGASDDSGHAEHNDDSDDRQQQHPPQQQLNDDARPLSGSRSDGIIPPSIRSRPSSVLDALVVPPSPSVAGSATETTLSVPPVAATTPPPAARPSQSMRHGLESTRQHPPSTESAAGSGHDDVGASGCGDEQPQAGRRSRRRWRQRRQQQSPPPPRYGPREAPRPTAPAVLIAVIDTGPGIPAGAAPLLFSRFKRLWEVRAGETSGPRENPNGGDGVGLGLSIVRELCRLWGGALGCFNRRDARSGACFWYTFPVSMGEQQDERQASRNRLLEEFGDIAVAEDDDDDNNNSNFDDTASASSSSSYSSQSSDDDDDDDDGKDDGVVAGADALEDSAQQRKQRRLQEPELVTVSPRRRAAHHRSRSGKVAAAAAVAAATASSPTDGSLAEASLAARQRRNGGVGGGGRRLAFSDDRSPVRASSAPYPNSSKRQKRRRRAPAAAARARRSGLPRVAVAPPSASSSSSSSGGSDGGLGNGRDGSRGRASAAQVRKPRSPRNNKDDEYASSSSSSSSSCSSFSSSSSFVDFSNTTSASSSAGDDAPGAGGHRRQLRHDHLRHGGGGGGDGAGGGRRHRSRHRRRHHRRDVTGGSASGDEALESVAQRRKQQQQRDDKLDRLQRVRRLELRQRERQQQQQLRERQQQRPRRPSVSSSNNRGGSVVLPAASAAAGPNSSSSYGSTSELGGGSVVSLPTDPAAARALHIGMIGAGSSGSVSGRGTPASTGAASPATAPPRRLARVLVVDDNVLNRKLLSLYVSRLANVEVVTACDGVEAVDIITRWYCGATTHDDGGDEGRPVEDMLIDIRRSASSLGAAAGGGGGGGGSSGGGSVGGGGGGGGALGAASAAGGDDLDFGLILMDREMPRMGGIEATQRIRQLAPETQLAHGDIVSTRSSSFTHWVSEPAAIEPGRHLPIVCVTAALEDQEGSQRRAYRQAGLDGVLHKPFDKAGLRVLLEDLAPHLLLPQE